MVMSMRVSRSPQVALFSGGGGSGIFIHILGGVGIFTGVAFTRALVGGAVRLVTLVGHPDEP